MILTVERDLTNLHLILVNNFSPYSDLFNFTSFISDATPFAGFVKRLDDKIYWIEGLSAGSFDNIYTIITLSKRL